MTKEEIEKIEKLIELKIERMLIEVKDNIVARKNWEVDNDIEKIKTELENGKDNNKS